MNLEVSKAARLYSIPPGVSFLKTLAQSLLDGSLVPGFCYDSDPLALSDVTIYLPTRRAVRELRVEFTELLQGEAIILPVIRALGEFEEELSDLISEGGQAALDHAPAIAELDRILLLAPLVQAWKSRLPEHVTRLFEEGVVVPTTLSDSIWLARDLATLMDEIETEEADWTKLAGLVPDEIAGWWQVTLEFLTIITTVWPDVLEALKRSNPVAHRNAMIAAEVERLKRNPPRGPVIAAGSTGSVLATSRLLATIARLDKGAVVLPGLDVSLDDASWKAIGEGEDPASCGHPQFGLKRLLNAIGVDRRDVIELGKESASLAARRILISEALRPAQMTDMWSQNSKKIEAAIEAGAIDGLSLAEAPNEREEASIVAVALRHAVSEKQDSTAALITADRELARRVASELRRFGIQADDSGSRPLAHSVPATLIRLLLETVSDAGDPIPIISLIKHPLLQLSLPRHTVKSSVELIELVALRGGAGRPDIATLAEHFETRLNALDAGRKPFWFKRLTANALEDARTVLQHLSEALEPLLALRGQERWSTTSLATAIKATVLAFEGLGRKQDQSLDDLYGGEAGQALAGFLRDLVGSESDLKIHWQEWPHIFNALIATHMVKPAMGGDHRISIWSPLEARLQHVDTLVLGALNEGSWPEMPTSDRFMSRMMKSELSLLPPERRIGQGAHDFMMAMGAKRIILTRAARAGNAPAVASRWLQRFIACIGTEQAEKLHQRGQCYLDWDQQLSAVVNKPFADRPYPRPALSERPTRFSVTEIETHRRDPYAIYARRILKLFPLDPIIRDPGPAERGTLFHDVLDTFIQSGHDPMASTALQDLLEIGRNVFLEAQLDDDIHAVWWPRFERTAIGIVEWEQSRPHEVKQRLSEIKALATEIGNTGTYLSGRADRIDIIADGTSEIIDYKTGTSPSVKQAHQLIAPQLALEAALLHRGAFERLGSIVPSELTYVRLRPDGGVKAESILKTRDSTKTGAEIAAEAWERLEQLIKHYQNPEIGYLSRALPFKESDMDGDYDHLARVLEWSAGIDGGSDGEAE